MPDPRNLNAFLPLFLGHQGKGNRIDCPSRKFGPLRIKQDRSSPSVSFPLDPSFSSHVLYQAEYCPLGFLQILLSTPIYTPPPLLPILPSPPLQALTFRLPKRKTLSLLCSLLNTFLNPSQAGWLDGVKNVPFGYLVKAGLTGSIGAEGGASADRDQLRKGAAGVLLGGLDYWFEEGEEEESKGNSFRYFLAKLVSVLFSASASEHETHFSLSSTLGWISIERRISSLFSKVSWACSANIFNVRTGCSLGVQTHLHSCWKRVRRSSCPL